jgi:hypothetical protein
MPDGGRADLRALDEHTYCFLSAANLAVNGLMRHITFQRYHQELMDFFNVDGSFLTAVYMVARDSPALTVHIAYVPASSFWSDCTVAAANGTVATLNPRGLLAWGGDKIRAAFSVNQPKLRVSTPEWQVVARAMAIRGVAEQKRLDVGFQSQLSNPAKAGVAPHGLLGQAWDGDAVAVNGKTDVTLFAEAMTKMAMEGKVMDVKTAANAEGAIEGEAKDYIVAGPMGDRFSTQFKFNRFGRASAAPRDISSLTGQKQQAGPSTSAGARAFIADLAA